MVAVAVGHRSYGDRSCHGVPRRVVGSARAVTGPTGVVCAREYMGPQLWVVVISAQRKPASSRAMATATMLRLVLRELSRRNRAQRRCCAVQDRAAVAGSTPSWP